MKYFIPTYEQAKEMVNSKGELIFYEMKYNIDGFDISLFNYRLASYNDFITPVIGKSYNAKELRGISFVFNTDGTLYNRYLMLNKFWNINQVLETQLNILTKNIKSVYNKEDGTLVSFIKLPNGKIIPKTKMSFDNEQLDEVKSYCTENIYNFVDECFKNNLTTYWEYVSFKNKIVLDYDKTNLILLKVRNNITGEYVGVENFRNLGFDITENKFSNIYNLSELLSIVKNSENIEGVVITFDDDYMVKCKSDWYFLKHQLLTENTSREDHIIKMILDDTLDDVKSQLDTHYDADKIKWIEDIEEIVKNTIIKKVGELNELLKNYNGNKKDFALTYRKHFLFSYAMNVINERLNDFESIKEMIAKETFRLESARTFLNNNKIQ